jgi:hypothetical protein
MTVQEFNNKSHLTGPCRRLALALCIQHISPVRLVLIGGYLADLQAADVEACAAHPLWQEIEVNKN